jgi:hypothetical protein
MRVEAVHLQVSVLQRTLSMPEPQHVLKFPDKAIMSNNCQGGVILPRDDGSVAMALFTREDKTRRFRAAHEARMFAGPSVKIDWDYELLLYRASARRDPHRVDVEQTGSMVLFIPVSKMKAEIRRRLDDKTQL